MENRMQTPGDSSSKIICGSYRILTADDHHQILQMKSPVRAALLDSAYLQFTILL